jgi:diketogulonate reductase-like aldo/keto reductase
MEDLYVDKRVRVIGLSNYSLRQLKEVVEHGALRVKPHVLQTEFHPGHQCKALFDYCFQNQIAVQAYASLGGTEKVSKDANACLVHNQLIKSIAARVNRPPGCVLLRWALQRGACIIPKSGRPERVKENTQLFDFELSNEMMEEINAMEETGRLTWTKEDFTLE